MLHNLSLGMGAWPADPGAGVDAAGTRLALLAGEPAEGARVIYARLTDAERDEVDAHDRAAIVRIAEEVIAVLRTPRADAYLAAWEARNMVRRYLRGLPPLEWPPT